MRDMPAGLFKRLVALRRRIHRWPEPAHQEVRTAAEVIRQLTRLGLSYRSGVGGGTGVVARLDTGVPGPVVALRADMDGLPVHEKTGLPFASRRAGLMHACGHDGHIAILLGAAELLKKRPPASGSVVFLFQPAEESRGGALTLIREGALNGVSMVFGGHLDSHYRVGEVGIRPEMDSAFTDEITVRIVGRGGHAARPHEAVDAVLIASLFVVQLQSIVSRSTDPLHPAVVHVGSVHAGTAPNAIADEALLRGTIRNTHAPTRAEVIRRVKKTAEAMAGLHGAVIEVTVDEGYPPVVNHPAAYALARDVAEDMLGREHVVAVKTPSMGGEDFAYYLQQVPGCFVRIGSDTGNPVATAHSSFFDFDEAAIGVGAVYFAALARRAVDALAAGGDGGHGA